MKKILVILLVFIMIFTALTSCNGSDKNGDPQDTFKNQTEQKDKEELEDIPIVESQGLRFVPINEYECILSGLGTCKDVDIVIPRTDDRGRIVKEIKNQAFKNKDQIQSIIIPDVITQIGAYAFEGCSSLVRIKIPNCVNKIGKGAFYDCVSLTEIDLPDSLTSISDGMFSGCVNLEKIKIPKNITFIGEYAFSSCENLKGIVIPEGVKTLQYGIFYGCSSLERVILSKNITKIEAEAFYGCRSLVNIIFHGTIQEWNTIQYEYNIDIETGNYIVCFVDGYIEKEEVFVGSYIPDGK